MINFSIILINYNNPIPLHYCLQQLLPQCIMDHDEIILVDDGSFPQLIDCEIQIDDRVHYTYLPRTNDSCRARARNHGAKLARNNWLIFIDGDCVPNNLFLTNWRQYLQMNSNNTCVLGSRKSFFWPDIYTKFDNIDNIFFNTSNVGYISEDLRTTVEQHMRRPLQKYDFNWIFFWSCNFAITKELYNNTGMDENFKGWGIEDIEFGFRLKHYHNVKIHYFDNCVYDQSKYQLKFMPKSLIKNYQYFYSKYNVFEIMDVTPLVIDVPNYYLANESIDDYVAKLLLFEQRNQIIKDCNYS